MNDQSLLPDCAAAVSSSAVPIRSDNAVDSVPDSMLPASVPLQPVKPKRSRAAVPPHPDCAKCCSAKKQKRGPSAWKEFLNKVRLQNPGMSAGESEIEARKRYVPPSGKLKSFERVYSEIWKARHPAYKLQTDAGDLKAKIREDFLNVC